MQSAIDWLDQKQLQDLAANTDAIARAVLLSQSWKDSDAVAAYMNPAKHFLKVKQAREECHPENAKLFMELLKSGDLPGWVLNCVDYATIELAQGGLVG